MLFVNPSLPKRILCLGAHSDDIEIGCGATLMRLLSENRQPSAGPGARTKEPQVRWVVLSGANNETRRGEAMVSAMAILGAKDTPWVSTPHGVRCLDAEHTNLEVVIRAVPDGLFPVHLAEVKSALEACKPFDPNLIFTHYLHDAHQDHRTVSEATYQTFRRPLILEYEIPKSDGDLGNPNVLFEVSRNTGRRKIDHLMGQFQSQHARDWYNRETFDSIMRIRGIQGAASSGYAEGFYCRRLTL